MKILLDENLPRKLKHSFGEHETYTVTEMGWSGKKNGELLQLLQTNGFDALITSDIRLPLQQPLQEFKVAVVLLRADNNRLQTLKELIPETLRALNFLKPGQLREVSK